MRTRGPHRRIQLSAMPAVSPLGILRTPFYQALCQLPPPSTKTKARTTSQSCSHQAGGLFFWGLGWRPRRPALKKEVGGYRWHVYTLLADPSVVASRLVSRVSPVTVMIKVLIVL